MRIFLPNEAFAELKLASVSCPVLVIWMSLIHECGRQCGQVVKAPRL